MKIVVGLGNPGREYEGTRHNVGFQLLQELNRRYDGGRPKAKFEADIVELGIGSEKVLLLAPQTYMNLSGRSVRKAIDFYQLDLLDVLVVCDDMNLPLGKIRLRRSGSSGGQKGLENIIQQMGGDAVPRLRIGIGSSGGRNSADYVLGRFGKAELEALEPGLQAAANATEAWVKEGLEAAMNRFNSAGSENN